ncbi:unnamed protein product [Trichobilharzia regenti]|nr:unnamed protein product [Trichobilharzia regenti]
MGSVMTIVRLHTKEFAHEVVDLLITHWWIAPNVQRACIALLSPMSSVLGAEFRTYLTRLIPIILRTFHHESNELNLIEVSGTKTKAFPLFHFHFCISFREL